jgi:hypothetical protein
MDQVEQKLMLASSHEKIRLYHLSTRGYIHHLLNNGPGAGNVHTFVLLGFLLKSTLRAVRSKPICLFFVVTPEKS